MRRILLMAAAIALLVGCKPFQMGTASVTPVKTGVDYELVTTAASKSHSRPIIFGVVFGEEKNFMDVMLCAIPRLELRPVNVLVYKNFGGNKCQSKKKGKL